MFGEAFMLLMLMESHLTAGFSVTFCGRSPEFEGSYRKVHES